MRRIEIPKEAIERHDATLGKTILAFLKRLKNGDKVWWQVNAPKGKAHDQAYKEMEAIVDNALECSAYWDWLHDQFNNVKILTAKPTDLATFAKQEAAQKSRIQDEPKRSAVNQICKKLFNYKAFRGYCFLLKPDVQNGRILWDHMCGDNSNEKEDFKDDNKREMNRKEWNGWNIAEFVRLLDVRYCPYCNAETVGTAMLPERIHVPDIDHIFPKDKYPLLSLSLYNLVPACNRCNSRFKKVYDMLESWSVKRPLSSLHPYIDNAYKHIRFDYRPESVGNLFIRPRMKDSPLTVSAVKDSDSRADSYIDEYHLNEIYRDIYAEEINEAIRMEVICSKEFVDAMQTLYHLTDSDFNRLFRRSSLDPREINHFRFAKLIIDLQDTIGSDISDADKAHIEAKLQERFRL